MGYWEDYSRLSVQSIVRITASPSSATHCLGVSGLSDHTVAEVSRNSSTRAIAFSVGVSGRSGLAGARI